MFVEHPIDWDDTKVARLWDYYAVNSQVPYFSELHGLDVLRQSNLPLSEPLSVIDFGCGPGFIWQHLKNSGSAWRYTGIDFSATSVEKLRKRADGDSNFVEARQVEGIPTPLEGGAYDVMLLLEVVEHLNDQHLDATFGEAARLVRRGGHLVISTPNDENLALTTKLCPECGAKFHEWQHVRSWSSDALVKHLAGFGFTPVRVLTLNLSMLGLMRGTADRLLALARRRRRAKPHMIVVFKRD